MAVFTFGTIPPELRNKIYKLVSAGARVRVMVSHERYSFRSITKFGPNQIWLDAVNLLLVSKSTHGEAKPVLASCLKIIFLCPNAGSPPPSIREYYYPRLRKIKLTACDYHAFDWITFTSLKKMRLCYYGAHGFIGNGKRGFFLEQKATDIDYQTLAKALAGGMDTIAISCKRRFSSCKI
jgi:hypothetical protein